MSSFIERTRQGAQALIAAVGRSSREPERAGYLVAAGTNVLASAGGARRLRSITKPLLMPLLAGRVLRSGSPDSRLGLLGLLGGWAGDLALMKPGNIPAGAAGFALNHGVYVLALLRRGARPTTTATLLRALPLGAATALAAVKAPKLVPVVLSYGGLLATSSVLAADPVLVDPAVPASYGLSHGGNLFVISDAVLLTREALPAPGAVPGQLADAVVMGTYTIAQLLLVDGLHPGDQAT